MASASFCLVGFCRMLLSCEMTFESKCTMKLADERNQISLVLKKYETRDNKLITTQGTGTLSFSGMLTTTISVVF